MTTEAKKPAAPDPVIAPSRPKRLPGDFLFGWTSHRHAPNFIFIGMALLSIILIGLDFGVHRHEYIEGAEFPAFYAIFGFTSFAIVVLSGWPLRKLLGRDENYYDDQETPPETTRDA